MRPAIVVALILVIGFVVWLAVFGQKTISFAPKSSSPSRASSSSAESCPVVKCEKCAPASPVVKCETCAPASPQAPASSSDDAGAIRRFVSGEIPCGEPCTYKETDSKPGKFFPQLRKKVVCDNILGRLMTYQPAKNWPPPQDIPKGMENDYTINGKCPIVQRAYYQQRYSGAEAMVNKWTAALVNEMIQKRKNRVLIGNYGLEADNCVQNALESMKQHVVGKVGLVVGSETPWVESISLLVGAKEIHTLEYGYISTSHPQVAAFLPPQFALRILRDGPQYDFVVSYSSLEHSGLGRYGDAMNPFGDIEAMSQMWCSLKPGGIAMISVPVRTTKSWGDCGFVWNAHRLYGVERFKHFWANFEILSVVCDYHDQPIIIGRKLE